MNTRNTIWNSDLKYAFGYYKLLANSLGIWPLHSQRFRQNFKLCFVTITQLWMSISLMKKLFITGNCGIVTDIVDVLSLIVCGFLTIMKVIIPRIHEKNMSVIINSVIDDWSKINNKKCRMIMIKYAFIGRLVFIIQMCGAYTVGFPLVFLRLPFINRLWNGNNNLTIYEVPIGPSCWIPDDISMYAYISDFILQSVQLFIVCTAYIGCDTYFFGIGMHLCGQFEVLHIQIENIYGTGEPLKQKKNLNDIIRRHNYLLQLAHNFEETYNMIILAQIIGDTLLICISAIVLLISLSSKDFVIIIGLIIRIYLVYIQLFMYSYVGENLSSQAEKLRLAIYSCPWYNMSRNLVKDMRFIIMRNHYRFNLTAGKMYSMNIENFKNILKTMGSYFSVLRLMFIED